MLTNGRDVTSDAAHTRTHCPSRSQPPTQQRHGVGTGAVQEERACSTGAFQPHPRANARPENTGFKQTHHKAPFCSPSSPPPCIPPIPQPRARPRRGRRVTSPAWGPPSFLSVIAHSQFSACDKLSLLQTCPSTASPLASRFQFLSDLFRKCSH